MSGLAATLIGDVRLQARNGFYWAVALLLAAFAIVVSQLPAIDWRPLLPAVVFGNLIVATFYFIGALVLLEKGEGTLIAQVVTPLTVREYLASKVATLTMLSLVESVLIVVIVGESEVAWLAYAAGVIGCAALYCLAGFLVVIRYDSISEYLFPTMAYTTFLLVPILDAVGLWRTPWIYLHPMHAPLLLISAGFSSLSPETLIYGACSSLVWIVVAFEWSRRSFRRFVIVPVGAR